MVLPFTIDTSKVHGGQFYTVSLSKKNGLWVAGGDSVRTSQLEANTPYVVMVSAEDGKLTFDGPVIFNTSNKNNTVVDNDDGSKWMFIGAYQYHKWIESEVKNGTVYGFAAANVSGAKTGEFVRVGSGAWINPLRGYLVYIPATEPEQSSAPMFVKSLKSQNSLPAFADIPLLPERIDFIINGDDETTTVFGWRKNRSGKFKAMDCWFDMKGRRLESEPSTRGIYYYNGKRTIVK